MAPQSRRAPHICHRVLHAQEPPKARNTGNVTAHGVCCGHRAVILAWRTRPQVRMLLGSRGEHYRTGVRAHEQTNPTARSPHPRLVSLTPRIQTLAM